MGLDLEWNKGARDLSKFASCNLKGNNFNQNILPYAYENCKNLLT